MKNRKARKKFVKIWFRKCFERFKTNYNIHRMEYQNMTFEVMNNS